ncbi:MAG: hypothetical protein V4793_47610, partial [Paraburkholderia tropica]
MAKRFGRLRGCTIRIEQRGGQGQGGLDSSPRADGGARAASRRFAGRRTGSRCKDSLGSDARGKKRGGV